MIKNAPSTDDNIFRQFVGAKCHDQFIAKRLNAWQLNSQAIIAGNFLVISINQKEYLLFLGCTALNLLNQNKLPQAMELAQQAEAQYSSLLTPALLTARPAARSSPGSARNASSPSAALADRLADQQSLADPQIEAALMGVVEVRRNQANILKWEGHGAESEAMAQSAIDLARARGWSQPVVTARLLRTSAEIAASQGVNWASITSNP